MKRYRIDSSNQEELQICPIAIEDAIGELFCRVGCDQVEAERVGRLLVRANLRGHDSHGVVRVNRYVNWVNNGTLVPNQDVTILSDVGPRLELDGNYGFGQTVGEQAMLLGLEKAKEYGVSVVSLRHAGHLGVIGDWAKLATNEGLISIHMANVRGSLLVAPYGGIARRASTAPFCAGVPRAGREPLILDFATSTVAEGKALVALKKKSNLPGASLISADGRLTDDPRSLYGETSDDGYPDARSGSGALTAFGQHKGSGLNLIMELLGGGLTGSGVAGIRDEEKRKICNGMLTIIIEPSTLESAKIFEEEVEAYCHYIQSGTPIDEEKKILLPGEQEQITMVSRLKTGIPLARQTIIDIVSLFHQYEIDIDEAKLIKPKDRLA